MTEHEFECLFKVKVSIEKIYCTYSADERAQANDVINCIHKLTTKLKEHERKRKR